MITIESSDKADSKWNERLNFFKTASIFQTNEYALLNDQIGRKPTFMKFIDQKGNIVAQLVGFNTSRFSAIKKPLSLLGKFTNLKNSVFTWSNGPVIFNDENAKQIYSIFEKFLLSKRCIVIGYDHPFTQTPFEYFKKPFSISKWGTFLIDLSKNQDLLWQNLDKHSARKNVERAQKKGVIVKEITKNELLYYQQVRKETKPVTLTVLKQRWNYLHDIGWTGFIAFHNNMPIGGIMISYYNGYINEWGIARTRYDFEKKLYAHDLLKWKIIEWGNIKKFKFYDLTGVNPNPANAKEQGIFRYKKKWGGNFVKFNKINLN